MWCVYGYSFVILQGFNLYFLIEDKRQGLITLGDFALVLSINTAIVEFFWNLVKEISNFSKASGKISQALRALVVTPDIQDRRHARELVVNKGEIIFEDVQFSYQGSDPLFQISERCISRLDIKMDIPTKSVVQLNIKSANLALTCHKTKIAIANARKWLKKRSIVTCTMSGILLIRSSTLLTRLPEN